MFVRDNVMIFYCSFVIAISQDFHFSIMLFLRSTDGIYDHKDARNVFHDAVIHYMNLYMEFISALSRHPYLAGNTYLSH